MAFAWIVSVSNQTNTDITLLQRDPTYHPVIGGHQFQSDEPIVIRAGEHRSDMSWFLIPWRNSGRLRINGAYTKAGQAALECYVDHPSFWADDHLYCVNPLTGAELVRTAVGPQGGGGWGSNVELALEFTSSAVNFRVVNYSPGVWDYVGPLARALADAAPRLAGSLFGF